MLAVKKGVWKEKSWVLLDIIYPHRIMILFGLDDVGIAVLKRISSFVSFFIP